MKKWNFKTRQYEPYVLPAGWYCPLYSSDMQEMINCASCGRVMFFGDTYTSRKIHNDFGFGYPVCGKCYQQELIEELSGTE